jgi:ribonuclease HII
MKLNTEIILPQLDDIEGTMSQKGYKAICGVDEVGRGPLAGPVVAAALIMPSDLEIDGLDDSKKLTHLQRVRIFEEIVELGLVCAIGIINNEDIDKINIHNASLRAMRKAVTDLKKKPDFILVDGKFTIPNVNLPQLAVVSGDSRCKAISAASIVAKVTRDRIMDKMQGLYPSFSFAQHKGYPTQAHLEELKENGPCDIHRKSFKPVAELIKDYVLF